jgi:hypothetical protein
MQGILLNGTGRHFHIEDGWVNILILVIIEALFVWLAARIILDRGGFIASIVTAVLGNLFAFLIWGLVSGILGLILAVLAWGLVAAIVFRTAWLKGAVIGVVAWLIWFLVNLALDAFL